MVDVGMRSTALSQLLPAEVEYCGNRFDQRKTHFGYEMPNTLYFPARDGR